MQPSSSRRVHGAEFKAQVMAECQQPGASVATVAMAPREVQVPTPPSPLQFLPVELPTPSTAAGDAEPAAARIDIELHRAARALACRAGRELRGLAARVRAAGPMIRIDALWLCAQPVDMRAGTDRLLAGVVAALGQAHAHHGYLFANARATRIKLVVHDGLGIWCAARRLHAGRFVWTSPTGAPALALTREQFDALVVRLPWQRLPDTQVITRLLSDLTRAEWGHCLLSKGHHAQSIPAALAQPSRKHPTISPPGQ